MITVILLEYFVKIYMITAILLGYFVESIQSQPLYLNSSVEINILYKTI